MTTWLSPSPSADATNSVSDSPRAGWSALMLRASKLSHSASASGPSAISQPMATNTSLIRSIRPVIGWIAPWGASATGSVTSTASDASACSSSAASTAA